MKDDVDEEEEKEEDEGKARRLRIRRNQCGERRGERRRSGEGLRGDGT